MKLLRPILAGSVALLALAYSAGAQTPRTAETHRAPIIVDGAPTKGLIEFDLTPDVFDLARPDLADIRVAADTGDEAAYVVQIAQGRSVTSLLKARLYNHTYLPGKQSSVTADFGEKVMKNRVEVDTPGTNFRRRVMIEGSDDEQSWQKVRDDAFLFRVDGGGDGRSFDKNAVSFPDNNQRYLRVTVYNGPDDPERVDVRGVAASHVAAEPPGTMAVGVAAAKVTELEKERATAISLDLGYRNLPLHELTLQFAEQNFFRRLTVEGRNAEERIIRVPVEDSPAAERKIEEPWSGVAAGVVYRYSSGGTPDESLTIHMGGARYRYVRIEVENLDDPPLRFEGAKVTRLVYSVAFKPQPGAGSYMLYFGASAARQPQYDLGQYAQRLRQDGLHRARLGKAEPNPASGAEKLRGLPWSEQHKAILWAALVIVLVVLSTLVWRQIKAGKR